MLTKLTSNGSFVNTDYYIDSAFTPALLPTAINILAKLHVG